MAIGMIGRKVGMMRIYDGGGRARGVTVIELGPNVVTQLRTPERDGYAAVQMGFDGNRKRVNRPERGHLRRAGVETLAIDELREFRIDSVDEYELGQSFTVAQFEPGQYVHVAGTSKGRGFAGSVKRWNFHGGPKTHGQSDRHRAPGSVGAGTTPGRVFKGQKMAGHMGARNTSVLNLLVVLTDAARNLIFVEGSVPGPAGGIVFVQDGRRPALADYTPPVLPSTGDAVEVIAVDEAVAEEAAPAAEQSSEGEATEAAPIESEAPAAEASVVDDAPAADAEAQKDEAGA